MKNPNMSGLKAALVRMGDFFFTHNRIIYFVLFMCALITAVASLNIVINQPSDQAYRDERTQEAQSPRFDEETIKKIQNLNATQQTIVDPPPANQRINPFGE